MAEEFIFIGRNKQNRQAAAKIRKTTTTEAGNLYKPSVAAAACTYTQGRAAGRPVQIKRAAWRARQSEKKSHTAGTKRRAGGHCRIF